MVNKYSLSVGAFIFLLSFVIFFPLISYLNIEIAPFDFYFFCNPGELVLSTERAVSNVSVILYPNKELIKIGEMARDETLFIETNSSYAVLSYWLSGKEYRIACG